MVWFPWTDVPESVYATLQAEFETGDEAYFTHAIANIPKIRISADLRRELRQPARRVRSQRPRPAKAETLPNTSTRFGEVLEGIDTRIQYKNTTYDSILDHAPCFSGGEGFTIGSWPIDTSLVSVVSSMIKIFGSTTASPAFCRSYRRCRLSLAERHRVSCRTRVSTKQTKIAPLSSDDQNKLRFFYNTATECFSFSRDLRFLQGPFFSGLKASRIREMLFCLIHSSPTFAVFCDILATLDHIALTGAPIPDACPGILFHCPIGSGKSTVLSSMPTGIIDTDWIAPLLDTNPSLVESLVLSGFSVFTNRWDVSNLTCPRVAFQVPRSEQIRRQEIKGIYQLGREKRHSFDADVIRRNKRDDRTYFSNDGTKWLDSLDQITAARWDVIFLEPTERLADGLAIVFASLCCKLSSQRARKKPPLVSSMAEIDDYDLRLMSERP